MICVSPATGWWKGSKTPGNNSQSARYALIVSIKSPDVDVDPHTPISTIINPETDTVTKTEVESFVETETEPPRQENYLPFQLSITEMNGRFESRVRGFMRLQRMTGFRPIYQSWLHRFWWSQLKLRG